ncbi:MAG TPA: RHS repeat-associated core domain-containing protein [Terriglobia bacterium]|nr:RHS repeat-associated core domain-containing protein [Terriglobia bacterium]
MTSDGTHTYQWDAEGRMTSLDSGSTATQKYNALGQRVERFLPNGSWTFDYLFGAGGGELGLYSAGTATWFGQDVPMGGRTLVQYGLPNGLPTLILHANKLGSTTVVADQTGAELEDQIAYPWGQTWTTAALGYDRHFAGMQQPESPEALIPTDFRKYNPALGRWMTPDPAGMAAADPSNPQSWNMYAYVLNNPVSNIDPSGLEPCKPGARNYENDCADDVATVDMGLVPSLGAVLPGSGGGGGGAGRGVRTKTTGSRIVLRISRMQEASKPR